ncbi:tRNA pseudouridine(13) synthase TruD [Proteus myxofaciens]|uniref:tRNA pseudouridine synthase D n=1 Tax=Proteus myxofaciens ATCC 19692 TaxID=1354337 RepID=A0A198GB10_9GAMM|nr:tRNA pseudouridine(13) synthase TruD [Proteus myxofaciens]OAT34612.1 tRNA pseudouridine 13 synthase [Proteus myxofaciens ATCC 19692]
MSELLELQWLHGKPQATGLLKVKPEDFIVREELGFTLDGEGEHVMVKVRKTGCNTAFVAEKLAKFVGIHPRDASYAGLKDRNAVTEQWFCLRMPGKEMPDFSQFELEGCEILETTRQQRKLRIGTLKGNYFTLVLRDISDKAFVDTRLALIKQQGVPNYFGAQRFGRNGDNLRQAMRWATNEIRVKERSKRSFYLSAARSAMFNHIVSERLAQNLYSTVLLGDAMQLHGRGSWFVVDEAELSQSQTRYDEHDIHITAPLPGKGDLGTQLQALTFETNNLIEYETFWSLARQERVDNTRRAINMLPEDMSWHWIDDKTVSLSFFLMAGSFATSVVRELLLLGNEDAENIGE